MSIQSIAERRAIIAKHMQTAQGRVLLAESMNRPLKDYRDYNSVARNALSIDPLGQGLLPYYDKDIDTPAYIVGEEGQDVLVVIKGERVHVPLFEIATHVTFQLTEKQTKRFDVEDRVKVKTKTELLKEEDKKIFNLFSTIANDSNSPNDAIVTSASNLSIEHFSDAMGLIETHGDIKPTNIFVNPKWNTVLRKINKDYYIDFETSKSLISTGKIASLYGATIHASSQVPLDEVYFTGEPEFTGVLVESLPLTVMSADEPAKRAIGFSLFEQIGIYVHNPKALSMIKISA